MEKEYAPMSAYDILKTRKSVQIKDVINIFNNEHDLNRIEVVFIGVYLSDEIKLQLFNLGFKYRTHLSPIGETCHVISLT